MIIFVGGEEREWIFKWLVERLFEYLSIWWFMMLCIWWLIEIMYLGIILWFGWVSSIVSCITILFIVVYHAYVCHASFHVIWFHVICGLFQLPLRLSTESASGSWSEDIYLWIDLSVPNAGWFIIFSSYSQGVCRGSEW